MSEQARKSLSISFRVDSGVIEHNNRKIIAKNVDRARICDNITYRQQDIKQKYAELFGQALSEYNAKQTQKSRRISDYCEHVLKSAKCKPFYEVVVQFGDVESCGLGSGNWEKAKLMLDDYMRNFEERNPNLKVFNAVLHLDESTPHLHIDFVPIARKSERGLSVKVSMKGALREQGFTSANRFQNEWAAWSESERGIMERILIEHKLSRDNKNVHREHLSVDEYKRVAAQVAEIKKVNAHINELKKKSSTELTADDFEQLNNQNDFLRAEIQKREKQISELSQKIGAKFVPLEIFSEEKLQFVVDELEKSGVPFVEENNAIYIPDYARKTAFAIADSFRPAKFDGAREKIRLDIDWLVYSSANLEDLLHKLQGRGYEIKRGKYLAVKSPNAERFVRLKTLGEDYTPNCLEKRIADREKFPNAVREKLNSASEIERKFHATILNLTVEIVRFRLLPKKSVQQKIYTFQNDANINFLAEQLRTIRDFHFTSREQIYAKAEELQADKTALQRVKKLIRVYEEIVDGNYIDNLVRAQAEQHQRHSAAYKI